MPKNLYVVEGNTIEVFRNSVVQAINPLNYSFFLESVANAKGRFRDRYWRYTAQIGDSNPVLNFKIQNERKRLISESGNVTINVVTKKSSPASMKYLLQIGDSFIDHGWISQELHRRLLTNTTEDGITGDGLSNITFVGNRETGDIPNEALGGQTLNYYRGSDSPFWNPNTSQIDFDYYCSSVLSPSIPQLDFVQIMLGTNDFNTVGLDANGNINYTELAPRWRQILDKLIAHNPAIKIIVTGRILEVPLGGGGYLALNQDNQYYWNRAVQVFGYNRMLEGIAEEAAYASNTLFVDALPVLDMEYNMPYIEEAANIRNSTLVKRGDDNVHPAPSGSKQIADAWYHATHHFFLE